MRKIYYFREFRCPADHKTMRMVEAGQDWVLCETEGCECAATRPRILKDLSAAVHGDEIDYIDHNLGPDPIHIRSKAERRRIMVANGREEFIRHTPVPGTDKSPYTTDWSKGSMDPYTLASAEALVRRVHGEGGRRTGVPDEAPPDPVANPFVYTMDRENPEHVAMMGAITDIVEEVSNG